MGAKDLRQGSSSILGRGGGVGLIFPTGGLKFKRAAYFGIKNR